MRTDHSVMLTGLPRSGTTLTCELLNLLPDTVAVDEPIGSSTFPFPSRVDVRATIPVYVNEMRTSLLTDATVLSKHVGGAVSGRKVGEVDCRDARASLAEFGDIHIKKYLSSDFWLIIKQPSYFTAVLDELGECFPIYAVIRHPLWVLSSWQTVPFPVRAGHIPAAESVDPGLSRRLASLDSPLSRQLHVLDWFFARFRDHCEPDHVLRYEEIIQTGGASLSTITPSARALREPLHSTDWTGGPYDSSMVRSLASRLVTTDGAWWNYYPRAATEKVAASCD